jgi:S1-C subfamily serine protease
MKGNAMRKLWNSATGIGDAASVALILVLFLLFLAACSQESPFADFPPTNSPNVKVTAGDGMGSATHIGNGVLVSAAHVTAWNPSMKVRFEDGQVTTAEVLWWSDKYDVAVMRYENHGQAEAANLACREPVVGEGVHIVGNPMILDNITRWGRVSGTAQKVGPWAKASPTDITIQEGMSGGGVFSDDSGDMIGVAVGAMRSPTGTTLSMIIPASVVCRWLARGA